VNAVAELEGNNDIDDTKSELFQETTRQKSQLIEETTYRPKLLQYVPDSEITISVFLHGTNGNVTSE
jgi:hypothetical protein